MKCRCGCDEEATVIVESREYDPGDPAGVPFTENCCLTSALYLEECAAEWDYPYKATVIGKEEV